MNNSDPAVDKANERALDNKVFDVIRENVKLEEQEISMADFEKLFQK